MKPIIGITPYMGVDESAYTFSPDHVKAIMQAGGMPVILPYLVEDVDVQQIAMSIDGLYMTGGDDIDPTFFGEEPHRNLGPIIPARDVFEVKVTKEILRQKKPILGVCRGSQILNIAVGGDMYQDIYAQHEDELLQHAQHAPTSHGSHFVKVLEGSLLHRITGAGQLRVNSRHHQANRHVPESFQVSGIASDGVVEAIESKEHLFVLGLQWHPENMISVADDASLKVYQTFVQACQIGVGGAE